MSALVAGLILLGYGAICILTYRDPEANVVTRLVDAMYRRIPPLAPIPYRTWYLIAGVVCALAGVALILKDLLG
jgi:uncharacterized membrane protein